VLRAIDLQIRTGELVAVVGLSGSGKTVLLHCLVGLIPCSAGRVLAADHSRPGAPLLDLATLSGVAVDRVRMAWSFVFQRNALFSDTVYENCALWLREHTELDEAEIERRVREALRAVALDDQDVLEKPSRALSGGMAKRVAVARAVSSDPVLLFYDEPTTGLDPVNAAHVHDLVWDMHFRRRADGMLRTTVLVTHDRDLLRRVHPRVVMLHETRIGFDGPYEAFTESSLPYVREYLSSMPELHERQVP
jgi:phospholipid/cholesterol/gamma-HCH transport system ATP-binding protein